MEDIQNSLSTVFPQEISNKILFKENGLTHPLSIIMSDIIEKCEIFIYGDSGGWEEFITFSSYYDSACKYKKIKKISIKYYIYGLENW